MKQNWNASQYRENASFVAGYGSPVVKLLNPQHNERILDLGCGDGALTKEIKKAGAVVHGVDSSPDMIEAAKTRGLSASVVNGEKLNFSNEFDAVFSNAALHWMTKSDTVIQGVFNALKPGGRFVGEFGGKGNIETLVKAMKAVFEARADFGEFQNPWYFPNDKEYKAKLQQSGFQVQYIELIPRPTPLKTGVREWLTLFSNGITSKLNDRQREAFLNDVEHAVKSALFSNGTWLADYVRLRFAAQKV
ncbi:class I SAM-dependent methyltransferase [Candidatus Sororendozoicomonas aggregata]|uniref:class I SAM-dependent methyltransferase n=1 Tax=Candidatus Sororendozoicomonas aggregata TaxID=3073239 RepID=UPI002ED6554F